MQVISENKDERSSSRGASTMDSIICIREIGRYMEGEYIRRFRREFARI